MAGGRSHRAPIPSCGWFLRAAPVDTRVLTRPPPFQGFIPSMGIDNFWFLGSNAFQAVVWSLFSTTYLIFKELLILEDDLILLEF